MAETIEIKKDTMMKGIIAVLVVLFIVSLYTGGFGLMDSPTTTGTNPTPSANPQGTQGTQGTNTVSPIDMETLIDDDHVKGDPNAPVTIVEFSDYECPFCARFYTETLGQIERDYIDTGKVKLIYRDFPLSFHPQAQKAAEAAECAGEQDMYYEMHDMLFESGVSGGVPSFKNYAAQLGLDTAAFNDCLDSSAMAAEVQKDFTDGQAAGIRGTPGFVINGQVISGALPYQNFKQVIDAELANA